MKSLFQKLNTLPDPAILFIFVGIVTILAMAAPHVGRRIFRLEPNDKRSDASLNAFNAIMGMTGVVLAFALVEATTNLHNIGSTVAKEGSAIAATDRALLRSGNPVLINLRPALAVYGKLIIDDEWRLMVDGDRSEKVDEAYNNLSRQARSATPTDARQQAMFAELLKSLDDIADYREQRIATSGSNLPLSFWVTVFGLLGFGFILALLTADTLGNTMSVGAIAAAVALILAFLMILDQPFKGDTSIKPTEISAALRLNARRS